MSSGIHRQRQLWLILDETCCKMSELCRSWSTWVWDRYIGLNNFLPYMHILSQLVYNKWLFFRYSLMEGFFVRTIGEWRHCGVGGQELANRHKLSHSILSIYPTMNGIRAFRKVVAIQRRNMSVTDIFENKNQIAKVRKQFYSNPEAGKYCASFY